MITTANLISFDHNIEFGVEIVSNPTKSLSRALECLFDVKNLEEQSNLKLNILMIGHLFYFIISVLVGITVLIINYKKNLKISN